jgi:acyl-coenzyme A synthetase/AMP-(fatty) acid ligase/acyl carrier protein
VLIRQDGLSNLVAWHRATYNVTCADRATLLANPAFDASVWELWPYLTAGASVHIPDELTRSSPPHFVEWLQEEAITLTFVPTPLAELLLDETWPQDIALRALLTGGDTLHRGPSRNFAFNLVNHYGPTENSVVTAYARLGPWREGDTAPPIGRPITNVQVYVLDRLLEPAPVGVPGELYIGGIGLSPGYLNDDQLTSEKFIRDPFSNRPGARLYKTGDRVRYLSDGNLEFLGRLDNQVKVRGFRIELAEIEAVLCRHPRVRHAAVLARDDSQGKRLIAYVVADKPPPDLGTFARRHLPEYMTPSAFVVLEELPVLPSGKVNRAALASIADHGGARTAFRAPRTAIEEMLVKLWAEVLEVNHVGIDDDFFRDLGGHSLLATRVVSRVRNSLGVELPLRTMFETRSVAGLADRIETLQWAAKAAWARGDVTAGEREEGVL